MQVQRLRDALQFDRTDGGDADAVEVRRIHDLLTHQHLAGSCVLRDPRRDVDGSAEVVTLLEDDPPGVDPDPGGGTAGRGWIPPRAGGRPCAATPSTMSSAANTPSPGFGKKNITPSPSHLTGCPPCSREDPRTRV